MPAPESTRLSIRHLSKTYANGTQALQDISLDIGPGMFGLLGPNGAGKSTLMRTLATLQEADSGEVTLGTLNVLRDKSALRQVLGYLPQDFGLYPELSALALLDYFAVLKGVTERSERRGLVEALLQRVNLWEVRHKKLGGFSGGMRQRCGIAIALIGNPRLLIVDEPTAGLDPEERVRFLNILSELSDDAVVMLSTHIVDDVAELCGDMAVIFNGRILQHGDPLQAVANLRGKVWRVFVDREQHERLSQTHAVLSSRLVAGRTAARVLADVAPDPGCELVESTLEDVYFAAIREASR